MRSARGLRPRLASEYGGAARSALVAAACVVAGLGLGCTRGPASGGGTSLSGTTGAAGAASGPELPRPPAIALPPLPPLPGDRLVARLTDLAGTAELQREGKSLAEELQTFDTPYKLVSPYSGLRGEAALRVIEVAVADPDVENYPPPWSSLAAATSPATAAAPDLGSGAPPKSSAPPRFDPVWNRFRGVYESKVALLAPAPSCYSFQLALPAQGLLSLYTAAVPPQKPLAAGTTPAALEFVVRVDGKELWRRTTSSAAAGRWLPAEITLPAGEAAAGAPRRRLSLCTRRLGPGPAAGVAVWGTPEVWAEGAGAKAPNLLLILVDTLRADAAAAMPRLQEYAQRSGVRFTQAITAATWTRPAVLALLGGDLPSAIGQNAEDMIPKERDRQRFYALDRHLLPRLLHEQGFLVSAIGNNFFLLGYPQIGLSLGFDEVADVRHPVLDSPAITRAALQFFARHRRRPFFLQLHYDAPHWPYSPPPEYLAKVAPREAVALAGGPLAADSKAAPAPAGSFDPQARAYLAEAAYADAELAKVLAGLEREGLAERTLVVIFGDHGEVFDPRHNHFVLALKQPTLYHHGWSAYDETLRVPLVIGMPGRLPAGAVVAAQVRLTDVAPTILEALGLPALRAGLPGGATASGQSLIPLMQGEREPTERPAFIEGQNVRALRADGYLYLRRSDPRLQRAPASATASAGLGPVQLVPEELYSLREDPLQHRNLLIGPRDLAVERALSSMRAAFVRNSPPLPEALLPVTHLLLAPSGGRSRVLAGVITSADAQLSVAGVSGGEVSPLGPGRLEIALRSGGRLDLNADADARLQLQLTLDGLPLRPEGLLLGPYSLPLLHSAPPGADLGSGEPEGTLAVSGAALARLTAAYPPVPGERGDVLLWRDQASPSASAPLWSRSTQATQGEVATMMRDWGYAQPGAAATAGQPGSAAGSPPPTSGSPSAAPTSGGSSALPGAPIPPSGPRGAGPPPAASSPPAAAREGGTR